MTKARVAGGVEAGGDDRSADKDGFAMGITPVSEMVAIARARIEELDTATVMGFAAAHLRDGFTDWDAQGGKVEVPAPQD